MQNTEANELLAELREVVKNFRRDFTRDPADAIRMADLVVDLDHHITRTGELPTTWDHD